MSTEVKKMLESLKAFYDGLSDLEFKERMQKAGFDIIEAIPGEIHFNDYEQGSEDFVIQGKVKEPKSFEPVGFEFDQDSNEIFEEAA